MGVPWAWGYRPDSSLSCLTCALGIGRIVTTCGPWNRPAGRQGTFVVNIEMMGPHSLMGTASAATRRDQAVLEGKAATEQEADEVIAPEIPDLLPPLDELALAVDAVSADVRSQVRARRRAGRLRVARRGDLDQRAGLGIAGAERGELRGSLPGKDDQVCLLVGGAVSCGRAPPFASTGQGAHLGGGFDCSTLFHAGPPGRWRQYLHLTSDEHWRCEASYPNQVSLMLPFWMMVPNILLSSVIRLRKSGALR